MGILARVWNTVFLFHEDIRLMVITRELLAYRAAKLAFDLACLTVLDSHLYTWVWAFQVEHLRSNACWMCALFVFGRTAGAPQE